MPKVISLDLGWFEFAVIGALISAAVWYGQSEEDKRKDMEDVRWLISLPKRLLEAVLRRLLGL